MTTNPSARVDHLAVTAPNLAVGATWVEQVLGVAPQPGGEHPLMGTHNLLLRLGESIYLEVIAVNPLAPPPGRPRWFGLDALQRDDKPRLRNWVARSTDIHATLAAAGEDLGTITEMSRGDLRWLITIPDDGKPPLGGTAPALIEWTGPAHPASRLHDHGLQLVALELLHPRPYRLMGLLDAIGLDGIVRVRRPADAQGSSLVAHVATPQGMRSLSIAD